MNRTRGFINQNRFKSGRSLKKLPKIVDRHSAGKKRGTNPGQPA